MCSDFTFYSCCQCWQYQTFYTRHKCILIANVSHVICHLSDFILYSYCRCQPCHASCQTCNGPSVTNCMLCPNDMPNENGACVSQCSEGFYKEYLSSGLKCLR